jgi:putative ABC transport system permease protein
VLHTALAGIRGRRARSLLTSLGIAIGVAAVVAFLSVARGLDESAKGLINLGGAQMGVFQAGVRDLTASTLPDSLVARIEREPGVAAATPVSVSTEEVGDKSVLVFGVAPGGFVMRRLVLTGGGRPRGAAALLGDGAAEDLDLRPGDAIEIGDDSLPVAGTYHTGVAFEDQGIAIPLSAAQKASGRSGEVTTVAVAVEPGVSNADVADRLERRYPGTVTIDQPGEAIRADTNSLLLRKSTLVIAILALVLGGLTAANTMAMAVLERRSEFALLAAVGWGPGLVARLVLCEGLILSTAGVAAGLALGSLVSRAAADILDASSVVTPETGIGVFVLGCLIGLAMGAVGALYPAWRAARMAPARALA